MPACEHVGNPFTMALTHVIDGNGAFALPRLARRLAAGKHALGGIGVAGKRTARGQMCIRDRSSDA